MAEKQPDPKKDKDFTKVVERMLKTPPTPHVKTIKKPVEKPTEKPK